MSMSCFKVSTFSTRIERLLSICLHHYLSRHYLLHLCNTTGVRQIVLPEQVHFDSRLNRIKGVYNKPDFNVPRCGKGYLDFVCQQFLI